jgi:hypothetical protein
MALDSTIMRYPDQFVRQNVYASQYDRFMKTFNNRGTKKINEDKYRFLNNCFIIPTGSVTLYRNYSEGLGITEYFRDDQSTQEFSKLVYFRKGSETWGNAVGTECSPLLDVDENSIAGSTRVRIIPNPMKLQAQVIIDGYEVTDDLEFVLYNIVGKVAYKIKVNSNSTSIDRNNMPAGLYIYTLKGKAFSTKGKLMVE